MRQHLEQGRARLGWRAGLWVWAALGCSACDALDPVETIALCGARAGVISENCPQCKKAPYAAQCPQCELPGMERGCAGFRVRDAGADGVRDGAAVDGAVPTDADVLDDSAGPAADGGELDAAQDAGCESCDAAVPECLVDRDCDADVPRCVDHECVPCTGKAGDHSCDHRDEKICDVGPNARKPGECVKCTGDDYAACGTSSGTPQVCDSEKRTCTTRKEHGANDCEPCVSDAECNDGQACVMQQFGDPLEDVGYFCFWKKAEAGDDCNTVKPAINVVSSVTSIDGVIDTLCMPSGATCLALNDVGNDCRSAASATMPDPTLCGFAHSTEDVVGHVNQDGYCLDTTLNPRFRCTVACLGSDSTYCPGTLTCKTATVPDQCGW